LLKNLKNSVYPKRCFKKVEELNKALEINKEAPENLKSYTLKMLAQSKNYNDSPKIEVCYSINLIELKPFLKKRIYCRIKVFCPF